MTRAPTTFDSRQMKPFMLLSTTLGAALPALAEDKLITPLASVRFEKRGAVYFADFGKAAFGNLQIEFAAEPPAAQLNVRLGEKLETDGSIDRKPGASINFREIPLLVEPGTLRYQLQIPTVKRHRDKMAVHTPPEIGEVTPFRYVEIEGAPLPLNQSDVRQLMVHAPFNDAASSFQSSDAVLNAVWDLCKHTMKATTTFGVYIDGERERIPYEADAYINQLSHYACDLDPRVARASIAHLLQNPTWPTEWSFHMPMMAAADYRATGDLVAARQNWDALKKKLLMPLAREDGLLRAGAIVDWPDGERDGYNGGEKFPGDRQLGPEYNTVVNAFYYHALREMTMLAHALERVDEARELEGKAAQVYDSFNRAFVDEATGLYTDGQGSAHSSLHANMFPLAFGLVPAERMAKVADFVQSRGMACSVYGAQYLLEGLFLAGKDDYAISLMNARTKRSWWHMIELGSTMTLEAWDAEFKPNLTWNHPWGAVPANILSRFVLGVRPLEPGYATILIAPQVGTLQSVRGQVPTAVGPVFVHIENADVWKLELELPIQGKARVALPRRKHGLISMDGKPVIATATGNSLIVEVASGGKHVFESR